MAVVINEFEVVPAAEPSQPSGAAAGTPKPPPAGAAPTPHDVAGVMRRLLDRAMRLRAH